MSKAIRQIGTDTTTGLSSRILLSALLAAGAVAAAAEADPRPLASKLDAMRSESAKKMPAEKAAVARAALDEVRRTGVEERSLKVGQRAPGFRLPNASGKTVSSVELLAKGPVVVAFYRGHW
ncbi:MAG: redoxin domain-containing protein [Candidatus Wallbacteria bacterium]|nr:redoxin domain-containing protein [Candidatus Wallbacteria bacterium]